MTAEEAAELIAKAVMDGIDQAVSTPVVPDTVMQICLAIQVELAGPAQTPETAGPAVRLMAYLGGRARDAQATRVRLDQERQKQAEAQFLRAPPE